MDLRQLLTEWKAFDDARPSLPGEHWLTAGAGVGLLLAALWTPSRLTSSLRAMAGGALLFRAASGRDGLVRLLERPKAAALDHTVTPEQEERAIGDVELGRS